jgi:hypothetical protein
LLLTTYRKTNSLLLSSSELLPPDLRLILSIRLRLLLPATTSTTSPPWEIKDLVSFQRLNAYSFSLTETLPYSIRVLLESAVRNCDEYNVQSQDVEKILDWVNNAPKDVDIPFMPARVILQDFT